MKNRRYSIGTYIFAPVMGVITLLMVILYIIFSYGDMVSNITNESYDNLQEKAENERNYLENKMTYEWSAIDLYANTMEDQISQYIKNNGYDLDTVLDNPEANSEMLVLISGELLTMLRNTKTTGSFVVLEGRATVTSTSSAVKPGLYFRDDDPKVNSIYNSDVVLQTAVPKVCDKIEVPMSSTWSSVFNLNSDKFTSTDFYYKPFEAYSYAQVNHQDVTDVSNYGYWSTAFKTDPAGDEIITYSRPLIVDNKVFGVVGIDVNVDEIWTLLSDYSDVSTDMSYIFGCNEVGGDQLQVIQSVGSMFTRYFNNSKQLQFLQGEMNSDYLFKSNEQNTNVVSYMATIKLYNNNTPFENMNWVVVSCRSKADIMEYTTNTRIQILVFILISFGTMGISLALLCRNISKPVKKLSDEVKDSTRAIDGKFTQTKIKELNELIYSFESMRKIILDNSNKISQIVSLTKLPLGVYEYDTSVGMTFCSDTLLDMFGWRQYATNGYLSDEDFQLKMEEIKSNVYDEENEIYELADPEGTRWIQIHRIDVDEKQFGTVMDVSSDVINQIKIEYERDYDVLTGLLNRRAFQNKVSNILTNPGMVNKGAMFMLDSDNLKFINDTYGHDTGDKYLKKIAGSFSFFDDYNHICGRFSGDEFYLFIYGVDHINVIRKLINHYWMYLNAQSIELPDGSEFNIRCSAGLAWYPEDSTTVWQLEQYADFAMYEMKHNSKGKWAEFNKEHFDEKEILLNGHKALENIISKMMIKDMFQPIVSVHNGAVYGYELLMRSMIPEFASPMDILRMARSQSRLHELEYVSIYKSFECYYDALQNKKINSNAHIFINSIGSEHLEAEQLRDMMNRFPHDNYDKFIVELTEEDESTEENLTIKTNRITEFGLKIAIDDYGSGYSNLVNMLNVEPSYIKVDMTIIRNIDQDQERQFVLAQAISLARTKSAMVVAEGIETKEELKCCMDLGVDLVQGYYIGRPSFEFNSINQEAIDYMHSIYKNN